MKVVVSWLNEYLERALGAGEIERALEAAGIEVEEVIHLPGLDPAIVVAEVKQIKPHPQADRLQLALVSTGSEQLEIVCGAPNIAVGQRVPLARVGATLPNGTEIKAAVIRGVPSQGMLCSVQELGIGEDHQGILELGPEAELGSPVSALYGQSETVLDIKTAANRPDLQSVLGLAREVAAHTENIAATDSTGYKLQLSSGQDLFDNQLTDLVTRYSLAHISLPQNLPETPEWLGRRLRAVGIKPINLVVDITNYVMYEQGQPLHAFDATRIKGKIIIRYANTDETFTTLDGIERILTGQDIVITDNHGVLALAGILGGESSEITSETREVLLEAATFNGSATRRSAIRHGLRTEASARFERNLPVQLVEIGLSRALELLIEIAGAEVRKVEDQLNIWPWVQHIGVRPERLSELAGIAISSKQTIEALSSLGFEAAKFDIVAEAKSHLGKPYKWGAKFKTDGTAAFDCGYLVDYLYSLIGKMIGHSAPQIMSSGHPIKLADLRPGDTLFRDGAWEEVKREDRAGVSHVALYIGDGQIIHAENYHRVEGEWKKLPVEQQQVRLDPVEVITEDPQFLGARRHLDNLNDYLRVTAPWWRPDISLEEDILEEVIKMVGLDKVPATLPAWQPQVVKFDTYWPKVTSLRHWLQGLGATEVTTYPFISRQTIDRFSLKENEHLQLKNPRSLEQQYLRTSLLPNLAQAVAANTTYAKHFTMFEVGRNFNNTSGEMLPKEQQSLAIVVQTDAAAYPAIKNILDQILERIHLMPQLRLATPRDYLHPSRQIEIYSNKKPLGFMGELHPGLAAGLKIKGNLGCLELDITKLLAVWQEPTYSEPSRYQPAFRDITLAVRSDITWQALRQTIIDSQLADPSYKGEYNDQNSQRTLTIHLEFSSPDKTLTDLEVDKRLKALLELLQKNHQTHLKD